MRDPKFKVGLLFGYADEFRKAVRACGIVQQRKFTFKNKNSDKVKVVCANSASSCEWFVYASMLKDRITN